MIYRIALAALPLALAVPSFAQDAPAPITPSSVVAEAHPLEWIAIPAEDLLVMELAPDADGNARTVVIQLMPAPFSVPWVENIRTLARAEYWDGSSINRVQDNYVVQWGQPDEGFGGTVKPVPGGLNVVPESKYEIINLLEIPDPRGRPRINYHLGAIMFRNALIAATGRVTVPDEYVAALEEMTDKVPPTPDLNELGDAYAPFASFALGWPIAATMGAEAISSFWPTHCYGMVGVGRDVSPDTGDGSQLYTVIGHAPRHLDRNIALVGRIIEGMEHFSSLPRGTGPLGFYESEEELVPILSARIASDIENAPSFEYLDTESPSFERYITVRANRSDDFYNIPAGGVDICNVPVPIRRTSSAD